MPSETKNDQKTDELFENSRSGWKLERKAREEERRMGEIRESKEYKQLERALMKRLKGKLDPDGNRKVKPDAVVKDLVRRYMDAWALAEDARKDILDCGHYCTDDRGRRYNNPSVKTLSDAEALMERLQRIMEVKTDDLAAAAEEDDDEL